MAREKTHEVGTSLTGAQVKHPFINTRPEQHLDRMRNGNNKSSNIDLLVSALWLGIAAVTKSNGSMDIAFACHDGTYSIDFAVYTLPTNACDNESAGGGGQAAAVANYIVSSIRRYQEDNQCKFFGVGLSQETVQYSPQAPARLWQNLDIVPFVFKKEESLGLLNQDGLAEARGIDELADSLARKCLVYFGPSNQPRVQVGFRNEVEVDYGRHSQLTTLEDYRRIVTDCTWRATTEYAKLLNQKGTKFAFFSATPQGGGVALMRHALLRFFRLLGVKCTWWVPKPFPEVFRITKTNHNILQGVANEKERLLKDGQNTISHWISSNAERFWTKPGGPLALPSEGGVDVVIVDDPQMIEPIEISKKLCPERPVIFRSHIQVRTDLAGKPGTPTAEVWEWLWRSVQHADIFISHPVKDFVPHTVSPQKLAYLPATTDWLDGLNKRLSDFDTAYYLREFKIGCLRQRMVTLDYPNRDYIIQIARFDPSKGIPCVVAAYAEFRRHSLFCRGKKAEETPQLVICGHSSIDDPDGSAVLRQTLNLLDDTYSDIKEDVVVMRLGAVDQILNALLANARVALQLSTREGFEIKVSEALHKGIPVIATTAGGIPLQVRHGKSGFLVEPGDDMGVAGYLDELFSDEQKYQTMSHYAATHVSDEVGTVGNALAWMYTVDAVRHKGQKFEPNGKWIWDLIREETGKQRWKSVEDLLPRNLTT